MYIGMFCYKSLIIYRMYVTLCHSKNRSKMSRLATSSRYKKQNRGNEKAIVRMQTSTKIEAGFKLDLATDLWRNSPHLLKQIHTTQAHELINIPTWEKETEKSHFENVRLWLIFFCPMGPEDRNCKIAFRKGMPYTDSLPLDCGGVWGTTC